MKVKLLTLAAVTAAVVVSVAVFALTTGGSTESNQDEETITEFAPVRAYAGFRIDTQEWPGLGATGIITVGQGTPAEQAGMREGDVVRKVGGENVLTGQDVYAQIEKKRPGQSIEIEVDRIDFSRVRTGSPLHDPEKLTFKLELLEEPAPGTDYVWTPWTGLKYEDQLRLGAYLADVTKPLAEQFGIASPGGAFVHLRLPVWFDKGLEDGDVIRSFDGKTVTSLKQLQALVDKSPEDRPIQIGVQRANQALEFTLQALGPSLPGANSLPAHVRERLDPAIESGGLHPFHLPLLANSFRRTDPAAGQSAARDGTIKRLSDSSITVELFDTGKEWTLGVDSSTLVLGDGAPGGLAGLSVGEFVFIFTIDGRTTKQITSRSAPLR
jgi:hypothetical protein